MIKTIDKILNKFGYYNADIPGGSTVKKSDLMDMVETYGKSSLFKQINLDLKEQDKTLYFQASSDKERDMIRGASARSSYFISLIEKSNDKRK